MHPQLAARLGVASLTILVTLTGCGELPPAPEAVDPGDLTAARDRPDPDLTLFIGPDPSQPDIIIYDIQNGFVYTGSSSQGNLILNVHNNQILDASNTQVLCRIDGDQLIEASSGTVLFTVGGKAVYEGGNRAGFAFVTMSGPEIYDGRSSRRQLLATASVDLTKVSEARRLLIAALLASRCGAPQLP